MHARIKNHFKKVDPILHKIISTISSLEIINAAAADQYFISLCREIVGQQLSGKAASTIFNRFLELFPNKVVTPEGILELKDQKIRDAGLSWSKVSFIKDLAEKILKREILLEKLNKLRDEELIETLTKIKGIGRWTVEMFMIFTLGRENVFSHGDLGLKKGFTKVYGIENPTKEDIEKIISKWHPYKSYGSRILWKSLDNE